MVHVLGILLGITVSAFLTTQRTMTYITSATASDSPSCVRQWKGSDPCDLHDNDKDSSSPREEDHDRLDQYDDTSLLKTLDVSKAQSLLLQQIIPTYAGIAESFSTSHNVHVIQISHLLEQLQTLASYLHIHLAQAIRNKIKLNGRKYPVEQAKGKMFKYTEYSQTTGITKAYGQSTTHFPNVYTGTVTTLLELQQLQTEIRDFAAQRDWYPYHTPRNLCLALGGELGELVEQLCLEATLQTDKLYQEVADVTIYLLRLADVCELSLLSTTNAKDRMVTLVPLSNVQSQHQGSLSSELNFPVGKIRNLIMKLWIHCSQQDQELFLESLHQIANLLQFPLDTASISTSSSTIHSSRSSTTTEQWLHLLCLMGELSDQFQFLGDHEQPLRKYRVVCNHVQQMANYISTEDNI